MLLRTFRLTPVTEVGQFDLGILHRLSHGFKASSGDTLGGVRVSQHFLEGVIPARHPHEVDHRPATEEAGDRHVAHEHQACHACLQPSVVASHGDVRLTQGELVVRCRAIGLRADEEPIWSILHGVDAGKGEQGSIDRK